VSEDPLVSIVVVTFNSAGEIARCLESVAAHAGVSTEVFLVDNASADDTVRIVRERFPVVQLVVNADNVGFSAANNQALALARGAYVLFLNPDTELRPGALPTMIQVLGPSGPVAAVGPRLVWTDGRSWRVAARRLPSLWTESCHLLALDRFVPRSRLLAYKYYAPWDLLGDRDVDCLSGAALLCRTAQVRDLSGFDESVPLYLDDIDLCRRLGDLGCLRYCSQAVVLHHHDASGAQQPQTLIVRLGLQATYRYFAKHRRWPYAACYVLLVATLGLAAGIFSVALGVARKEVAAQRERRRCITFVGWAFGSKAGPWPLPREAPADVWPRRVGRFPNLG
jgi:hypothetical protein